MRVQRGKRLVQKQDSWIDSKRTGQRGALPHTTRKLVRIALRKVRQPARLQQTHRDSAPLGAGDAADLKTKLNIFANGPPWQKQILLQHERHVRIRLRNALAIDIDLALSGWIKAGAHVEQRALPASGRSDQRDNLTVCD